MSMHDVGIELPDPPADIECCEEIPIAPRADGLCLESGSSGAAQKKRFWRSENE
jgi:hypothetical protein